MMERTDLFHLGEQILAAQSFSQTLGTTLVSFSEGDVVLDIPIKKETLQQNGFAHGGLISYAADCGLTFAGGSVLGAQVLTSELKINYAKPAVGHKLRAHGYVVSKGKRQSVSRCDIYVMNDKEETLCAAAQGTITLIQHTDNKED